MTSKGLFDFGDNYRFRAGGAQRARSVDGF
jgi:hypothetical protein